MEQLLRLLILLGGIRNYSVAEIAEYFGTSTRSVYRHFRTLEDAGFVLIRSADPNGMRYLLATDHSHNRTLKNLLHFSDEEVNLMYEILTELEATSSVKERLIRKLNSLYDLRSLARKAGTGDLEKIKHLNEAISEKKQVRLAGYRSSHGASITDRMVEPIRMQEDYKGIWCYDVTDRQCKQFIIARIGEVEKTPFGWRYETEHDVLFTDAFRMSLRTGDQPETVTLSLSMMAYNLLLEEFPQSKNFVFEEESKYMLRIPIADYAGIGRFVLGLPGEIEVLETEGFKEFLREKRKICDW